MLKVKRFSISLLKKYIFFLLRNLKIIASIAKQHVGLLSDPLTQIIQIMIYQDYFYFLKSFLRQHSLNNNATKNI